MKHTTPYTYARPRAVREAAARCALLLGLLALLCLPLRAQDRPEGAFNTLRAFPAPSLVASPSTPSGPQGLSGMMGGTCGEVTLVVGGCNFPQVPAAQGGEKAYSDAVWTLEASGPGGAKAWHRAGRLPQPVAYGRGLTTPYGLLLMGGNNGRHTLADVLLININTPAGGAAHTVGTPLRLPPLPVPLEQFAAAYDAAGDWVYVAMGLTEGGRPQLCAWRMKLSEAVAGAGAKLWQELPALPEDLEEEGRAQPSAAVQNDAAGASFYIFGGYRPAVDGCSGFVNQGGLCYDAHTQAWRATAALNTSSSMVGAEAQSVGCQHIVLVGGVNSRIFTLAINSQYGDDYLLHEPAWYGFEQGVAIYHTITDTWQTQPIHSAEGVSTARAGATLIPLGGNQGRMLLVGGEYMPGLRSASCTELQTESPRSFGPVNWAVLLLYLAGMLLLGFYFMRREGEADDFFKGGGRIPWWAAGISIYATMLSAITYMAYPAKAYATDWTYYPMLVTILLVSLPVVRYYLPFFRRLGAATAYEYLERRFNATTRLMASALFIVFMVARMALVLYLPSLALTAATGLNIYLCIVLMGLVTIVYCTMGGVEAVVWGDVVQGVILVGGALVAFAYLVGGTEGGLSGFWHLAQADDKMRLFQWSLDYRSATFWVIILGGMANNLISYTSDQTVIQRYLTTKDEGAARRSILLNGVMSVVVSVVFFAIGAGLYTFYKTNPAALDITLGKADCIFPFFMVSQLPQGLAGLLIAAIFAATMSTISSNINSVATAWSVDFHQRLRPGLGGQDLLRVARWACVVSGLLGTVLALLMATWNILSLLDFFQEILGLLCSGLGALFLMGIFFPRIGGRAALLGFLLGLVCVGLTKYLTDTSFLLYGFIGLVSSTLFGLLFSLLLREPRAGGGLTWKSLRKE